MAKSKTGMTLKGPWEKTSKDLKRFATQIEKVSQPVVEWAAKIALKRYQEAYQGKSPHAAVSALRNKTRTWRNVGKLAGGPGSKTPWVVPKSNRRHPLNRTGALWHGLEMKKEKRATYRIQFNKSKRNPEGSKTLQDVANMQESGWVATFRVSRRMMAYLHVLFNAVRSKKGYTPNGDQQTGISFSVRYPARPVFGMTTEYLEAILIPAMKRKLSEAYKKLFESG